MKEELQNPLLVQLSNERIAMIEWGYEWYPGGRALQEERHSLIDWKAMPIEKANDLSNPRVRVERHGKVEKVKVVGAAMGGKSSFQMTAADLRALLYAEQTIASQTEYARLSEIYS